ncbi:MAG TPA: class I SAM-dependent methyltransferase [Pyrinomonadaceae bacterium]|nr:class I SAM-dependent methyltransferase [Pyrinomonadaceae bacterium]
MPSDFIYDDVPYPSFVFPQTSPDRLATLAHIHGIDAAPPSDCRMLELGCGDGTNLLALAFALPDSRFVGIDLAATHINSAKTAAEKLGLKNVEFFEMDVTEADAVSLGEFDYIVAHGLFSWVPEFVRPAIFKLYAKCLAPNGVGYISYNALPGCLIREITHGMMRFATRAIADPNEKVASGIKFLETVVDAAEDDSVYQTMLDLELEQISERTPQNVFHDDLSEMNRPFYFEEFAGMLKEYGFQYVCEAEPSELARIAGFRFPEELGSDVITREQYRDFVTGRRFRTTLFCRKDLNVDRTFPIERIHDLSFAGKFETEESESDPSDASMTFVTAKGHKFTLNHPLTKTCLIKIADAWPRSLKASDLIGTAEKDDAEVTLGYLMQLYKAGFIKGHSIELTSVTSISEKPEASRFARFQIEQGGNAVATLTGLNLEIRDPAIGKLLVLTDGTRDIDDLAQAMLEYAAEFDQDEMLGEEEMRESVLNNLEAFAESGLLVG